MADNQIDPNVAQDLKKLKVPAKDYGELLAANLQLQQELAAANKEVEKLMEETVRMSCVISTVCKKRDEAKREVERLKRERKYIFAEISGYYKGLMTHPSDTPLNGCLISEGSKKVLGVLNELIKRYEQPENL